MSTLRQIVTSQEEKTIADSDKELELLIGAKERAFGALNQHRREHNC